MMLLKRAAKVFRESAASVKKVQTIPAVLPSTAAVPISSSYLTGSERF
jgi:hypothetical protein